jgi:hypothetical protein
VCTTFALPVDAVLLQNPLIGSFSGHIATPIPLHAACPPVNSKSRFHHRRPIVSCLMTAEDVIDRDAGGGVIPHSPQMGTLLMHPLTMRTLTQSRIPAKRNLRCISGTRA